MLRILCYLLAGVVVFFGLRLAFKKLKIDSQPHDRIWTFWFRASWDMPEAWVSWVVSVILWPLYAAASICWLGAELFHLSGKNEIMLRGEIEAKRDKRYDHLTLDEKITLLEAEAGKRK